MQVLPIEEYIKVLVSVIVRLLFIVVVISFISYNVVCAIKPSITDVQMANKQVVYNGTEQTPDFIVKSDGEELAFGEDYTKEGNWIGEECGKYNVGFNIT